MYAALKYRLYRWIFRPRGRESGAIVLSQRRVFILPTRHGVTFAAVLALMLLGSINYNLSLGFVLTFLLGALGVNAMIYTFRNLANLRVTAGRVQPVFAGEKAHFTILIENPGGAERYGIGLTKDRVDVNFTDVGPQSSAFVGTGVAAPRRGLLRPGRLTVFTCYPLGLFFAWSYFEPDMTCVVYPRPAPAGPRLPEAEAATGEGAQRGQGRDDFAGLRQYHPGDSPRHIAWKAAARGQGLLTKQFSGRAETELWLDWQQLPRDLGVEGRLSLLARWVIEAHTLGLSFGLRLPARTVALGSGDVQREACLQVLALFDQDDEIAQQPHAQPA
jgi:uncharacterized protein (DUF58 family)